MQPLGRSTYHRKALIFKTGQITSYVAGDDGAYEVGENHNYEALTTGQYSGTTSIVLNGKTDAKINVCVMDHASGLMWSRYVSGSVGPTSNGLLPWTTNGSGEGIFAYVAAANAAAFAGHTDWRVPNIFELYAQCDLEPPNGLPNATAFPGQWLNVASSTSLANSASTNYLYVAFGTGTIANAAKTSTTSCVLVRGPLL